MQESMFRRLIVTAAMCAAPLAPTLAQEPPGRDSLGRGDGRMQLSAVTEPLAADTLSGDAAEPFVFTFTSRADSLEWAAARARAERASGLHVVVSLQERRLWTVIDDDTLMTAHIAVATDSTLEYQGKRWTFETPRGERSVLRKDSLPVWIPPDWHYYEVAKERGLVVKTLPKNGSVRLEDGRRLEFRFGVAGVIEHDGRFTALPTDEEIVFDGVLYMPPYGTKNRRIIGELGKYRLDLGDGYLFHGTPYKDSIGQAATHGCIRLDDEDIAWLYEFVPVGTRVYIY